MDQGARPSSPRKPGSSVLGISAEASRIEVEREAQKLLGMLELGFADALIYATPLGPRERTAELVRAAVAALARSVPPAGRRAVGAPRAAASRRRSPVHRGRRAEVADGPAGLRRALGWRTMTYMYTLPFFVLQRIRQRRRRSRRAAAIGPGPLRRRMKSGARRPGERRDARAGARASSLLLWSDLAVVAGAADGRPADRAGARRRHAGARAVFVPAGHHRLAYYAALYSRPGADPPAYALCAAAWASRGGEAIAWVEARRAARASRWAMARSPRLRATRGGPAVTPAPRASLLRSIAMLVEDLLRRCASWPASGSRATPPSAARGTSWST